VLGTRWDHSVHAPLAWTPDSSALLFMAEDNARQNVYRFDVSRAAPEVVVRGGVVSDFATAGGAHRLHPKHHEHSAGRVLAGGEGEKRVDRFNDDLVARWRMGEVREFRIKGWKGDEVQMWAIYPPDFDPARKWPLLHNIHGGPHSAWHDHFHFRWNNQVFAAQGYVVVCVNYHGSRPFGQDFLESIDGSGASASSSTSRPAPTSC
jgi:dipeptidyl aminopeptidase/acylaminoacyl peptidase